MKPTSNLHVLAIALVAACWSPSSPPSIAEDTVATDRTFPGPLTGCPLQVHSEMSTESTGTMHYADRVVLGVGPGSGVVVETSIEHGALAPIVERVVDLGGAFLVMGWSSSGGGEQTNTAFIVEGASCGGLRLVERLDFTAPRGRSALLFDAYSGAVGVPRPSDEVDQRRSTLKIGAQILESSTLNAMNTSSRDAAEWYAPMTLSVDTPGEAQAVWFCAGAEGFEAL